MTENSTHRLLAVMAHPDDESFGIGGTLALYARRGVEVHLICATRGEVGETPDGIPQDDQSVGKLREDELRCAGTFLGLKDIYFLGYRDSGMQGTPDNLHSEALAAAPEDEVAARITLLIRQIRPQVVVTFDPFGGYGHPDHIATQRATLAAFHAAGTPDRYPDGLPPHQPERLYYYTFPRRWMKTLVRVMSILGRDPRKFGRNQDIDLSAVAEQSFPIHATIDVRSVVDVKQQASACHSSQSGPPSRGLLSLLFRRANRYENFMRAHPPVIDGRVESDLFADMNP
jgi:LmbE family N-acetylglucosaminyl deacetylase